MLHRDSRYHRDVFTHTRAVVLAVASVAVVAPQAATDAADGVRLSRGGICHDSTSPHFARLKEFTSFSSMSDCVAAGGRPPRSMEATQSSETPRHGFSEVIGWGVAILAVLTIAMIAGWPTLRRLYRRFKNRDVEREFRAAELRRWRGHRLQPKENSTSDTTDRNP